MESSGRHNASMEEIHRRLHAYRFVIKDIANTGGHIDPQLSERLDKYDALVNAHKSGIGQYMSGVGLATKEQVDANFARDIAQLANDVSHTLSSNFSNSQTPLPSIQVVANNDQMQSEFDTLSQQLEAANATIADLNATAAATAATHATAVAAAAAAGHTAGEAKQAGVKDPIIAALRVDLTRLTTERDTMKGERDTAVTNVTRLTTERDTMKDERDDTASKLDSMKIECKVAKDALATYVSNGGDNDAVIAASTAPLTERINILNNEIANLTTERDNIRDKFAEAKQELTQTKQRASNNVDALTERDQQLQECKNEVIQVEQKLQSVTDKLTETTNKLTTAEARIEQNLAQQSSSSANNQDYQTLEQNYTDLKQVVLEKQAIIDQAKVEVQYLKAQLAACSGSGGPATELTTKISKLEKDLEKYTKKNDECRGDLHRLTNENTKLKNENTALKSGSSSSSSSSSSGAELDTEAEAALRAYPGFIKNTTDYEKVKQYAKNAGKSVKGILMMLSSRGDQYAIQFLNDIILNATPVVTTPTVTPDNKVEEVKEEKPNRGFLAGILNFAGFKKNKSRAGNAGAGNVVQDQRSALINDIANVQLGKRTQVALSQKQIEEKHQGVIIAAEKLLTKAQNELNTLNDPTITWDIINSNQAKYRGLYNEVVLGFAYANAQVKQGPDTELSAKTLSDIKKNLSLDDESNRIKSLKSDERQNRFKIAKAYAQKEYAAIIKKREVDVVNAKRKPIVNVPVGASNIIANESIEDRLKRTKREREEAGASAISELATTLANRRNTLSSPTANISTDAIVLSAARNLRNAVNPDTTEDNEVKEMDAESSNEYDRNNKRLERITHDIDELKKYDSNGAQIFFLLGILTPESRTQLWSTISNDIVKRLTAKHAKNAIFKVEQEKIKNETVQSWASEDAKLKNKNRVNEAMINIKKVNDQLRVIDNQLLNIRNANANETLREKAFLDALSMLDSDMSKEIGMLNKAISALVIKLEPSRIGLVERNARLVNNDDDDEEWNHAGASGGGYTMSTMGGNVTPLAIGGGALVLGGCGRALSVNRTARVILIVALIVIVMVVITEVNSCGDSSIPTSRIGIQLEQSKTVKKVEGDKPVAYCEQRAIWFGPKTSVV